MKEVIGDFTIEIRQDDNSNSPREWDNLGTMVCFHNRYRLGDKDHGYNFKDYNSWEELRKDIIKNEDALIVLPLRLYDHSGISISTSTSYPFNDQWDSMMVGFIFISKDKVRKEYNKKLISKQLKERVIQYLIGEVKVYDQFLTGDIYGFMITDNETEEEKDSCWGFYGYDECLEEAKSITHYLQSEKDKEKKVLKLSAIINDNNIKELGVRI